MSTGIRLILGSVLTLVMMIPVTGTVAASPTGYEIAPEFQSFYYEYGGLKNFGYAVSPPVKEDGRLVQYTERQRFEFHPEYRGTQWEVLLGLLGRETARAEGKSFQPGGTISGARFFNLTQQYLDPHFEQYWESRGGIRIFGYPITSPRWEDGILVQYTERARFEYHPALEGSGHEVLLGRLGSDLWNNKSGAAELATTTESSADLLAEMLNAERASAGVGNLNRSASLNQVATGRSEDMGTRGYFSHTTPDGQNIFDIMRGEGLTWSRAGETLHRNNAGRENTHEAAERALRGFMNSTEHKRILMDGRYQEFGVGYAYGSDGRHYFTVIVMTR